MAQQVHKHNQRVLSFIDRILEKRKEDTSTARVKAKFEDRDYIIGGREGFYSSKLNLEKNSNAVFHAF